MNGIMEIAKTPYGSIWFYNKREKVDKIKDEMETLTWEPAVTEVIKSFDYEYFIDVGAGFGYYSLMASDYAKEVYAFEPHPVRYGMLLWNTTGTINVHSFHKAVGGQPYMSPIDPTEMASSKGNEFVSPVNVKINHNIYTDTKVFNRKEGEKILAKIDVEGFETIILENTFDPFTSLNLLHNTIFIIEVHPKWKHLDVRGEDILPFFDYGNWQSEQIGTRNHFLFYWEE